MEEVLTLWRLQRLEAWMREASGKVVRLIHCLGTGRLGRSKWMVSRREVALWRRRWEVSQGIVVMTG